LGKGELGVKRTCNVQRIPKRGDTANDRKQKIDESAENSLGAKSSIEGRKSTSWGSEGVRRGEKKKRVNEQKGVCLQRTMGLLRRGRALLLCGEEGELQGILGRKVGRKKREPPRELSHDTGADRSLLRRDADRGKYTGTVS